MWRVALALVAAGSAGGLRAHDSFRAGEKLTFDARWGVVPAARLTLEAVGRADHEGEACWRFVGTARSRGPVEVFYPVRSKLQSTALEDGFQAREYLEDRKEGSHRYHRLTVLDFDEGRGRWINYGEKSDKKLKLSGPACDLLSVCYRVRSQPWKVGDRREFRIFADGKYHEVVIEAEWRGQREFPVWGEQAVIKISSDEVFEPAKNSKGRMEAYLTDDMRHVPLLGRLKVSWGTVEIVLAEAEGLAWPLERRAESGRRPVRHAAPGGASD
ncbi:MAG: DUF3108 domain-containing protein [Verrucomicrobiae bacterium]|nr:DUF3108 domain-containing protein [Verrucomicrobiae bacterium]